MAALKSKGIEPFRLFLAQQIRQGKITPELIQDLLTKDIANRILDNANNQMGAPTLGPGTGVALHGQLHEFTGDIPDIKGRNAYRMEEKERLAKQTTPKPEIYPGPPTFKPTP